MNRDGFTPNQQLALDMARLEWAHIEAFDNEALPPVEVDSLSGVDPERFRLRLQPYIMLLELGYEVDEFLIKIKQGDRLRDEASNAMEMRRSRLRNRLRRRLRPKTVYVAVHRFKDSVYYKRIDHPQFVMLSAFQKNATIAEACDELVQSGTASGDVGADVKSWFATWASLGWFCALIMETKNFSYLAAVTGCSVRGGEFVQSPVLLALRLYWGWQFFITGRGHLDESPKDDGVFSRACIFHFRT